MPKIINKTKAIRISRIRKKGEDFLAGKTVRKNSLGKECFDDYFTDQSSTSIIVKSPIKVQKSVERTQTSPVVNEIDRNLDWKTSATPKLSNNKSSENVERRESRTSFSAATIPKSSPLRNEALRNARTRLSYDSEEYNEVDENRLHVYDVSNLKRPELYTANQDLSKSKQTEHLSIAGTSKFVDAIVDDDLEIEDDVDFLRLDLRSAKSKRTKKVEQKGFSDESSEDEANELNKHKNAQKESLTAREEASPSKLTRKQRTPKKLSVNTGGQSREEESSDSSVDPLPSSTKKKSDRESSLFHIKSAIKTQEQLLNITDSKRGKSLANEDVNLDLESSDGEVVAEDKKGKTHRTFGLKNSTFINQQNVSPKWPSPWKIISTVADVGPGTTSSDSDTVSEKNLAKTVKSFREVPNSLKKNSVQAVDNSKAEPSSVSRNRDRSSGIFKSPSKLDSSVKQNAVPIAAARPPKEFISPKGSFTKPVRRSLIRPSVVPVHLDMSSHFDALTTSWGRNRHSTNNKQVLLRELDPEVVEKNVQTRSSKLQQLKEKDNEENIRKNDALSTSNVSVASMRNLKRSKNNLSNEKEEASLRKSPRLIVTDVELEAEPPSSYKSDTSLEDSKPKKGKSSRSVRGSGANTLHSSPGRRKREKQNRDLDREKTDESDEDSDASWQPEPWQSDRSVRGARAKALQTSPERRKLEKKIKEHNKEKMDENDRQPKTRQSDRSVLGTRTKAQKSSPERRKFEKKKIKERNKKKPDETDEEIDVSRQPKTKLSDQSVRDLRAKALQTSPERRKLEKEISESNKEKTDESDAAREHKTRRSNQSVSGTGVQTLQSSPKQRKLKKQIGERNVEKMDENDEESDTSRQAKTRQSDRPVSSSRTKVQHSSPERRKLEKKKIRARNKEKTDENDEESDASWQPEPWQSDRSVRGTSMKALQTSPERRKLEKEIRESNKEKTNESDAAREHKTRRSIQSVSGTGVQTLQSSPKQKKLKKQIGERNVEKMDENDEESDASRQAKTRQSDRSVSSTRTNSQQSSPERRKLEKKTIRERNKEKTDENDEESDASWQPEPWQSDRSVRGTSMKALQTSPERRKLEKEIRESNEEKTDESDASHRESLPKAKQPVKANRGIDSAKSRNDFSEPKNVSKEKKVGNNNTKTDNFPFISDAESDSFDFELKRMRSVQQDVREHGSSGTIQKSHAIEKQVDEQQPGPSGIKKTNKTQSKKKVRLSIVEDDESSLTSTDSASLMSSSSFVSSDSRHNEMAQLKTNPPRNSLYSRDHLKRNRLPPLEFWRNQRPVYKRNSTGTFSLYTVDEGFEPIIGYETKLEIKKNKKNENVNKLPQPPKAVVTNKSDESNESDVAIDMENYYVSKTVRPILVVNPMDNEEVFVDCLKVKGSYRYTSVTGKELQPEDTIIVAKPLRQKAFSSGIIVLKPGTEKGMHFLVKDTMVFWVLTGTLEVTIHETTVVVNREDSFFVPLGNKYNIRNISEKKASKLLFFQHRGD